MAKSKQAKAREFSKKAREEIYKRDGKECFFCKQNYHMEKATPEGLTFKSVMHYIPRSRNGLGIPQNGAVGCQYHHEMMDNGNAGLRAEMLLMFREYLQSFYPDLQESELVYRKWNF